MAGFDKFKGILDMFFTDDNDVIDGGDFDKIGEEIEKEDYILDGNAIRKPKYSSEEKSMQNVRTLPTAGRNMGYEVIFMEPRVFKDAAAIVQHLKDRKTVVLNLHLLDKEQSQRTVDFVCGASTALNGKPQQVSDLVFVFTPSNVCVSVETNSTQSKFNDSLWGAPLQQ